MINPQHDHITTACAMLWDAQDELRLVEGEDFVDLHNLNGKVFNVLCTVCDKYCPEVDRCNHE